MSNFKNNDDNPEWTDEDFSRALYGDDIPLIIRKAFGRPKKDDNLSKKAISLRLDPEVLEYFKSTGKGWQTRINNVLKEQISRKA